MPTTAASTRGKNGRRMLSVNVERLNGGEGEWKEDPFQKESRYKGGRASLGRQKEEATVDVRVWGMIKKEEGQHWPPGLVDPGLSASI